MEAYKSRELLEKYEYLGNLGQVNSRIKIIPNSKGGSIVRISNNLSKMDLR